MASKDEAAPDEADSVSPAPPAVEAPEPTSTEALPGEPYDFGPAAGAGLRVVGITLDETLYLLDAPGGEILAELQEVLGCCVGELWAHHPESGAFVAALAVEDGIVATGRTRSLSATVWYEVRVGELVGWAGGEYLAPLGARREITPQVLLAVGSAPEARTLDGLGVIVAEAVASAELGEEGPVPQIVTAGVYDVVDGEAEVTMDLLGFQDDSVRGYRLDVTALPDFGDSTTEEPNSYTLGSVLASNICYSHRGVTEDGLCI